jgi:hypothetical protein
MATKVSVREWGWLLQSRDLGNGRRVLHGLRCSLFQLRRGWQSAGVEQADRKGARFTVGSNVVGIVRVV